MHPFLLSMQWIVTPLYTHWRHHGSASCVREGCQIIRPYPSTLEETETVLTNIDDQAVFCKFNPTIEQILQNLHSHLRKGNKKYQAEIDRYLVACRGPQYQHLVLPRGRAPHYDNLPDFSFYTMSILDASKDNIPQLQQIFLLLRQCTPLRRRTKRAQRELQWEIHSLHGIHHLVQSMQGTLLGLYPTCARSVAFITRVQVYRFIRSLLVADFATLNHYLQKIRYVLKICVMEHLCNTIMDYYPGVCHMLNKSGQQLQHFCHAVTTVCDIFRGDLNLLFEKKICIVGTILQLEKNAQSFFERCTRAYRGIITSPTSGFSSLEIFRKKNLTPDMNFIDLLPRVYSVQNQYVFDLLHKDRLPKESIDAFWHLTQCINVKSLPVEIRQLQYQALARRYPHVRRSFFCF